eukprot:TRINITY_DN9576_c0_g1_i1.p1 TRINITY_DN9576_c0_g1~~TRINITY_DN9576_c0_g1_i1.p1  ORF type:complete len:188 (+),score=60.61 TRINITY_DN9576_c0_g1_i1:60-623(+)
MCIRDSNIYSKASWVQTMTTQNELINALAHPNICNLLTYVFNGDETYCEIIVQDCGFPLLILKEQKTGELIQKIILDSLAALEYIEKQGFSFPFLNVESLSWDTDTHTAKLTDSFAEKTFPKWALSAYDAIRLLSPEYAAPELLPFCSDFHPEPENFSINEGEPNFCLLYTSPSPRDQRGTRMPSSA